MMRHSGIVPLLDETTSIKEEEQKCMKNIIHHSPRRAAVEVKVVAKGHQDGLAAQETYLAAEEITIRQRDRA